ncbi:DUF1796 family putative cysteine peptidase [Paenibacillus sp. M1]|uniref:DUF1796 family putative cysteine peptidase n=1 Tax=Paenibacillus haidiansis TaxID=1574488 RepID=A0ABU7VWU5_9BACL
MRLFDIQKPYHAIYSLGDLCTVSIQLERNGLRPYAGPLDWMASYSLPDVIRLLGNRFAGFMDYDHLVVEKQVSDKLYLVKETYYNVYSNHDFFTHNNTSQHLAAYPEVKAKYDRRVQRFLEKAQTSPSNLFIRTGGTFAELEALRGVLAQLVAHSFDILLVNHTSVQGIVEEACPVENCCSIQLPDGEVLRGNDHLWEKVLSGIRLVEEA